jgi:hypothetical protein
LLCIIKCKTLIKIKDDYLLTIPEAIARLYLFEEGQTFNLEIKESNNNHKLIFLTYATSK